MAASAVQVERLEALLVETDEVLARRRDLTHAKRRLADAQALYSEAEFAYERALAKLRADTPALPPGPLFRTQAE